MINFIQKDLMWFAIADFCLQILIQMPVIEHHQIMEMVGLRKVWILQDESDL